MNRFLFPLFVLIISTSPAMAMTDQEQFERLVGRIAAVAPKNKAFCMCLEGDGSPPTGTRAAGVLRKESLGINPGAWEAVFFYCEYPVFLFDGSFQEIRRCEEFDVIK